MSKQTIHTENLEADTIVTKRTNHKNLVQLPSSTFIHDITPISASGLNINVYDTILYLNSIEIIFSIGKYLVLHNTQTRQQIYIDETSIISNNANAIVRIEDKQLITRIPQNKVLGDITAMTMCVQKKYLCVARKASQMRQSNVVASVPSASIRVYDLNLLEKAQKNPRHKLCKKKLHYDTEYFCSISMSGDGKLLCGQTVTVKWTIVVWDYLNGHEVATIDVHSKVSRIYFNPYDQSQISTNGPSLLRIWKLSDRNLSAYATLTVNDDLNHRRYSSYVDHVWVKNNCLVACMEAGDIRLHVNGTLVQTLYSIHNGYKLQCITRISNSEGIVVGGHDGLISVVRVGCKSASSNEVEMTIQRRLKLKATCNVSLLIIDPNASTLLCCTERSYGTCDLQALMLLKYDDECIALNPLHSPPLSNQGLQLSCSSKRSYIVNACKGIGDEFFVNVWDRKDCKDCQISYQLEAGVYPVSLDIHPSGSEVLVALTNKIQTFFILHDSIRLGFETSLQGVTSVSYSQTGAYFVAMHCVNRMLYIFQTTDRNHYQPRLIATYQDFCDSILSFVWSIYDTSGFAQDASGVLYHLAICDPSINLIGEVLRNETGRSNPSFVQCISQTQLQQKPSAALPIAVCAVEGNDVNYVVFLAEKTERLIPLDISSCCTNMNTHCHLRAWASGNLATDILVDKNSKIILRESATNDTAENYTAVLGLPILHDITVLCPGNSNILFAGTSTGAILIMYWDCDSLGLSLSVQVHSIVQQIDVHIGAIIGMAYFPSDSLLISNSRDGTLISSVLSWKDTRTGEIVEDCGHVSSNPSLFANIQRGGRHNRLMIQNLSNIHETAVYDKHLIELEKLKLLDLENEVDHLKTENELRKAQVNASVAQCNEQHNHELEKLTVKLTEKHNQYIKQLELKFENIVTEKEKAIYQLSCDIKFAEEQHIRYVNRLQIKNESLQESLALAKIENNDLRTEIKLQKEQMENNHNAAVDKLTIEWNTVRSALENDLKLTKRKLDEVLHQVEQDHLDQITMLSTSAEKDKRNALDKVSIANGNIAALHQEIRMLLNSLDEKDCEVDKLKVELDERTAEVQEIMAMYEQEQRLREKNDKELQDLVIERDGLKQDIEKLVDQDSRQRSQIELLHNLVMPKDSKINSLQADIDELADHNQRLVSQICANDRALGERTSRIKRLEQETSGKTKYLDHIYQALLELEDKFRELMQKFMNYEKKVTIQDFMELQTHLRKQLEAIKNRDENIHSVNKHLHLQNSYLLRNRKALQNQVHFARKEKSQVVAALSYQNAGLMKELNALLKDKKILERQLKSAQTASNQHTDVRAIAHVKHNSVGENMNGMRKSSSQASEILINHSAKQSCQVVKSGNNENNRGVVNSASEFITIPTKAILNRESQQQKSYTQVNKHNERVRPATAGSMRYKSLQ